MKSLLKKASLWLSTIVIGLMSSCHLDEPTNDVSLLDKNNIVTLIKQTESFRNFLNGMSEFESRLENGKLKVIISNEQIKLWQIETQNVKDGSHLKQLLAKMYNDPDFVFLHLNRISKSLNRKNLLEDEPLLNLYSYQEITDAFGLALKESIIQNRKSARISDCMGNCSEDFNISDGAAQQTVYVASVGCGLLSGTVVGAIGCYAVTLAAYYVSFSQAITTLGQCGNRCAQE
jgi:hypothetical protein